MEANRWIASSPSRGSNPTLWALQRYCNLRLLLASKKYTCLPVDRLRSRVDHSPAISPERVSLSALRYSLVRVFEKLVAPDRY